MPPPPHTHRPGHGTPFCRPARPFATPRRTYCSYGFMSHCVCLVTVCGTVMTLHGWCSSLTTGCQHCSPLVYPASLMSLVGRCVTTKTIITVQSALPTASCGAEAVCHCCTICTISAKVSANLPVLDIHGRCRHLLNFYAQALSHHHMSQYVTCVH